MRVSGVEGLVLIVEDLEKGGEYNAEGPSMRNGG